MNEIFQKRMNGFSNLFSAKVTIDVFLINFMYPMKNMTFRNDENEFLHL